MGVMNKKMQLQGQCHVESVATPDEVSLVGSDKREKRKTTTTIN